MTAPSHGGADPPEASSGDLVIRVVEERLALDRRRVAGSVVRVSTATETVEEAVEVALDRYRVEVTRVPVGRAVEVPPLARAEGDTTIVPVVEERLVLVKQLFLKEELHIRHVVEREVKRETVALRRQRATVERVEAAVDQDAERAAAAGSPQATKAPFR